MNDSESTSKCPQCEKLRAELEKSKRFETQVKSASSGLASFGWRIAAGSDLARAVKTVLDDASDRKFPSTENSARLVAAFTNRVLRVGFWSLVLVLLPTFLSLCQLREMRRQNFLITEPVVEVQPTPLVRAKDYKFELFVKNFSLVEISDVRLYLDFVRIKTIDNKAPIAEAFTSFENPWKRLGSLPAGSTIPIQVDVAPHLDALKKKYEDKDTRFVEVRITGEARRTLDGKPVSFFQRYVLNPDGTYLMNIERDVFIPGLQDIVKLRKVLESGQ